MSSGVKCKACKSMNEKYAEFCSKCGKPLYSEISFKTATITTLVLDSIFALLYIFGTILFVLKASNTEYDLYTRMLPIPGTSGYYLVIIYLLLQSISKIFFVFNYFFIKHTLAYVIRKVFMYIEGITMFPIQTILALYFYNVALNEKKIKAGN